MCQNKTINHPLLMNSKEELLCCDCCLEQGKKKGWDEHIFSLLQLEIEFVKDKKVNDFVLFHISHLSVKPKLEFFI